MMQPGGGMMQGPMDQQQGPQSQSQWGMMAPLQLQYQQPQPPTWGQQQSQIPSQIPPQQQQYPPQYQAPPPPQQYLSSVQQPGSSTETRSLWIGDLQYWMDEAYLQSCFSQPLQNGELLSVKIIRNRQTGQSEGYGFLEFATHATAERVLQSYNGQMMLNVNQAYKMNWASLGAGERRDHGADYTIFVGDLASDVTDYILEETFKAVYSSVKGAKVVIDRTTGRSKGYGFVRFGDVNEQTRAMTEMNGTYCSSRPMRIGPAASKKSADAPQQYTTKASYQTQGSDSESDPNNTTIFVGGLDASVSEDLLRETFYQYGELVHVKIPVGKGCGFVQFANRANAEEALKLLHGTLLGGQNIRLSWGRSPNKQPQHDSNQWNGSHYGYTQGYDNYGYAPPQDPNMYAYTAYQGYGNYQQ
ncbi:putative RNA recognition motif domain, nucleotide-binding alpha-beta plait domain superfamily [Dioscorea sansibarensis]